MSELTGKIRYRQASEGRWNPKPVLVLQVEERGMVTSYSCGYVDTEHCSWWRDAKTEDLSGLPL